MFERTEVVTIMAHLLITVCLIVLYGVSVILDKPDTTLQNLLLIAGGFWFGATGGTKIKEALSKKKGKNEEGNGEG